MHDLKTVTFDVMDALVDAFDAAAQDWGWAADQGVGAHRAYSRKQYENARNALFAALETYVSPVAQSAGQEAVEWHGLTEDERNNFVSLICSFGTAFVSPLDGLVKRIEAKLRERNAAPANGGERSIDCPRCAQWISDGRPVGSLNDPGQHHCESPSAALSADGAEERRP